MDNREDYKKTLTEIRELMEGSVKVHSISGVTGIIAGLAAIAGVLVFYFNFNLPLLEPLELTTPAFISFLLADGAIVLAVTLIACYLMLLQTAGKSKVKFWTPAFRRLFTYWFIPLCVGGLLFIPYLTGASTIPFSKTVALSILFFGLAQVGASKYSFNEFFWQGIIILALGIKGYLLEQYSLLIWVVAFGLSNIIIGIIIVYKYDRVKGK